MSKGLRNMAAGGGAGILFLLQISFASSSVSFLFFPAAVLYLATYTTAYFAFATGVLMGSVWDSISLGPFGVYALGLGMAMGGASACMRLVDERSLIARVFVSSLLWIMYVATLGVVYLFLEKETLAFMLFGYDAMVGFIVLLTVGSGCFVLQKLFIRR